MSLNFTNVTEIFPPLNQIDFSTNCSVYGQWLSSFIATDDWAPDSSMGGSITHNVLLMSTALGPDFAWQGIDWSQAPALAYTLYFGQINQWFTERIYSYVGDDGMWYADDEFLERAIWKPMEVCPKEFCKAIGYTGNTDITGIGVMVSYYIEAILCTLFLVAFTIWHFTRNVSDKKAGRASLVSLQQIQRTYTPTEGFWGRFLNAFRGSLQGFLSSAILMSAAMSIAAIYTAIIKRHERYHSTSQNIPRGSAIYDIALSLLASVFTVFPIMLLYSLLAHPERGLEGNHRKWIRRAALALTMALCVTEVYLAPEGELDYDKRHDLESSFWCDQRGGIAYWNGLKAGKFLAVGLPVLWAVLTVFVLTGFKIPGLVNSRFLRGWRMVWRLVIAWINLFCMWGLLVYFTRLRHNIIHTAGSVDTDDHWSFGQVFAIATWVPVVTDFLYILFFGLAESLTGHMPVGFHATADGNGPDDDYLMQQAKLGFPSVQTPGDSLGTGLKPSPEVTYTAEPYEPMRPVSLASPPMAATQPGPDLPGASPPIDNQVSPGTVANPPPSQHTGTTGVWNPTTNSWQMDNAWQQWHKSGW